MSQIDAVKLLTYPFGRLGAQYLALGALVRFDLIDDQLDFPALMIQANQHQGWGHARIEQGGHQAIDLARLSEPLIGHAVREDAHPHPATHGIMSLASR